MRRTGHLLALSVLLLALVPAQALAKKHKILPPGVAQVLRDCSHHSHLVGHYPAAVLQEALSDMPSDLKEYTICANEIRNALQAEALPSRPLPQQTVAQRAKNAETAPAQLAQAQKLGAAPVNLAGEKIAAGAVGINGSLLSDLPTPLLIVLIGFLALGAAPLALRAHHFVRARRTR